MSIALLQSVVIAITSLILAPGYLVYFDVAPKVIALLTGTALVLLLVAITGFPFPGPKRMPQFSMLSACYAFWLALATAFSIRPALSFLGTDWRRFGGLEEGTVCVFGWLIAAVCAGCLPRVLTVLRGIAAAGAVSASYGILQYLGRDPLLPPARYHFGEGIRMVVRPPGTLGHGNYFATWLLFVLFLSLALRTLTTSPVERWLSLATAWLAGCAMVLTGTRAAVVGFVIGVAVWAVVERVRPRRRASILAGFGVLAATLFFFSPAGQLLRARARSFTEDPWGGERIVLWRDSLRMARHHLFIGFGPEVFTSEFRRYESLELIQSNPGDRRVSTNNMFLDALVADGIPGMLLLAWLCGAGFRTAFRLKQPAFAAALASGIISQQFSPLVLSNALILWTTLGLLAALDMRAEESMSVQLESGPAGATAAR